MAIRPINVFNLHPWTSWKVSVTILFLLKLGRFPNIAFDRWETTLFDGVQAMRSWKTHAPCFCTAIFPIFPGGDKRIYGTTKPPNLQPKPTHPKLRVGSTWDLFPLLLSQFSPKFSQGFQGHQDLSLRQLSRVGRILKDFPAGAAPAATGVRQQGPEAHAVAGDLGTVEWIGLRENLKRKPGGLCHGNVGGSCKFSRSPIHWQEGPCEFFVAASWRLSGLHLVAECWRFQPVYQALAWW